MDSATKQLGDVNGDNVVNVADINYVINVILGSAGDQIAADVNNDKMINVSDVNLIINIILDL